MTTLTEFLLARIAEDEAAARAAGGDRWASLNRSWDEEAVRDVASVTEEHKRLFAVPMDCDEHVARWHPARVLAECEAKRRTVERFGDYVNNNVDDWDVAARVVLGHMASVYADHPDFDPDWTLT